MARFLFGTPGDWCSRHPRVMLGAVLLLTVLSQWLVDLVLPPVVMP
ncbi:hypothetical protein GTP55_25440 [Duganella sp. FT109W]|uniref:Rod shape-determining protein MreD n=1 Tax=Duganella margarita TaxID=2692170 RepID=A0ABW9WR30_9BURK|nr:hypothetical protein [Duganella margarita]MYN42692.1 hypothetical protein [Duganella margarita]